MERSRIYTRLTGALLLSFALVGLLAACGATTTKNGAMVQTPTAASILQDASKLKVTDATMTFALDGTTQGQHLTGNGTVKLTSKPKRTDSTMTLSLGSQQFAFESITDGTTGATYTKFSQPAALATGKWSKQNLNIGSFVDFSNLTNFSSLKNPTFVGATTVDGVPVWHLKAQYSASGENATADLYFNQQNAHPVEIAIATTGAAAFTMTIHYTAINSGIAIDLPPATEIQAA